jgi:hypothetical protein
MTTNSQACTHACTPARRTSSIKHSVLIVGVMLAGTAAAETPEQHQACMDDAFQFCSEAMPDRERVFACLAEKRHLISPLCREGMAAFLPPEPPPVQVSRIPPKTKAHTKHDSKTKTDTKTKPGSKKAGAPLSLTPKAP